jgi:hypothetical protein
MNIPVAAIAGCTITAVFVLFGIDLRAVAWGGRWLRDSALSKHA